MSVRVCGTSAIVSLNGVSCVDASEGGGTSSFESSDGVLFGGVELVVSGEGGGGVVGARNRSGRSPSTCWRVPFPPPQLAEVRGGAYGVVVSWYLGEVGGVGWVGGDGGSAMPSVWSANTAKRLLCSICLMRSLK